MLISFGQGRCVPLSPAPDHGRCARFGYYFADAPSSRFDSETLKRLDAVHARLVETAPDGDHTLSGLPPLLAYFGQFIEHDISAAQGDVCLPDVADDDLAPMPRDEVLQALVNTRTGRFELDSIYGCGQGSGNPALDKLNAHLRDPGDRAKMWVGNDGATDRHVVYPASTGGDLLRLGHVLDSALSSFNVPDLFRLPEDIRRFYLTDDGEPRRARAVIGDARNDENPFIARLHLAGLHFHNRIVDAYPGGRCTDDEDEVFKWAREQVRRFYQWLVVNAYLPAICDTGILASILQDGPILYDTFLRNCNWSQGDPLPIPVEYSAAACRFGPSIIPGAPGWNTGFGSATDAIPAQADGAPIIRFPGHPGMSFNAHDSVPSIWGETGESVVHPIIRFANQPRRQADTAQAAGPTRGSDPISRDMRRGILHDLASAQAIIAALGRMGIYMPEMSREQIASGPTGDAIRAGGFDEETPLWLYVVKEAEIFGFGQHLGPLGSHLVAGTIIGLIKNGPDPVLDMPGSVDGLWHPVDGPRVGGEIVDSCPALIRAAFTPADPEVGDMV